VRYDRWIKLRRFLAGDDVYGIVGFNDRPKTTFKDILARLRKARDSLRA
jgi:hypothetical protein